MHVFTETNSRIIFWGLLAGGLVLSALGGAAPAGLRQPEADGNAGSSSGIEPTTWLGTETVKQSAWAKLERADEGKLTWGNNSSEKKLMANQGAVRLSGRTDSKAGSHYLGAMLPVPVREVRQQQIVLDIKTSTPEAVSAIYVRLYDAGQHCVASWSGHPKIPAAGALTLQLPFGAGSGDFAWEAREIKGEGTMVASVEIIVGARQPDTSYDLSAANLRLAPIPPSLRELTKVKPLFLETPVINAGRAVAAIVAPAKYRGLALELQARIRSLTGAGVPVLDDGALADAQGRWTPEGLKRRADSLVVLGNLESNHLVPLLYARFYTLVDAFYPGQGGYALHTIHDPWGNGHNVIVVGGSDDGGVREAAGALLAELAKHPPGKDLVLPKLMDLKLSPAVLKTMPVLGRKLDAKAIADSVAKAKAAFERGQHTGVTENVAAAGLSYYESGHDGYAEQFKQVARLMIDLYRSKPKTYGGPWGMDADFNSMQVIAAWDLVEESPVFSEAERLEMTRIIAEYAAYWETFGNVVGASKPGIRHNHNTFPCLGMLFAGEYFGKYYHAAEAARWLAAADACFRPQALSFKSQEDANGYQWLTIGHVVRYSLARPDYTFFANGNARRALDLAIGTLDNLCWQSPFGDVGGFRGWASEIPSWNVGARFFNEPAYRWAVEQERLAYPSYGRLRPGNFEVTAPPPKAPAGFEGTRVFPIEPRFYDYWARHVTNEFQSLWVAPVEQCYEKISFRGSFEPQAPYLLLDGIGTGAHRHYDGNAFVRYTDRGRVWFADGDYIKALPKFHTSLLVFRDGQSSTLPPFCALEAQADFPRAGMVRSTVRYYGDADWSRNVIWLKGAGFVAIDSLKAGQADDYSFRAVWQTVGEPRLSGNQFALEQTGERCVIENLDGARLKVTDDAELGKNWSGYSNAAPVIHVLQQIAERKMKASESYHFLNVFAASSASQAHPVKAERASASSVLVTVRGEKMLAGVTEGKRVTVAPGVETDAALYVLRPHGFSLAKATTLLANGRTLLHADSPADVELDAESGRAVVQAANKLKLSLGDQAAQEIAAGRQELTVPNAAQLVALALPNAAPLPAQTASVVSQVPQLPVRWTYPGTSFTCIATADLDGDGKSETLVGTTDGRVCCLGPDGQSRWEVKAGKEIKALWAGELNAGQRGVVAAGSADGNVYLFDAQGSKLWAHAFPYYKNNPVVNVVFAADLRGDGKKAIIAGTESWRFYALDAAGTELWRYESVRRSACGTAADLDGDGKQEVIAGTEYYWWHAIAPDGQRRWHYSTRTGPYANAVAAGDLNGDGKSEVVFGGADGNLHVLNAEGDLLWQFNTGDEVTGVAVSKPQGKEPAKILATSMGFNLYAFDGKGRKLWRRDHGDVLHGLLLLGEPGKTEVAVGGEDGRVVLYDTQGIPQGEAKLAGPVTQLKSASLTSPNQADVVVLLPRSGIIAVGSQGAK